MATGRWEILHMHRIFRKDQVLTIPNLLSVIRLALIPLIVWLYIGKQEYSAAVAVILISGATDIIDGFIARKFNMVSDLGKILDPVADKLTQATVILCLTVKYRWMRGLIVLFVVKEIIMAVLGYMAIQKKDVVNSAKWYGKLNTVVLYLVMTCLILFPSISETVANVLIGICICVMLMSLTLYICPAFPLYRLRSDAVVDLWDFKRYVRRDADRQSQCREMGTDDSSPDLVYRPLHIRADKDKPDSFDWKSVLLLFLTDSEHSRACARICDDL